MGKRFDVLCDHICGHKKRMGLAVLLAGSLIAPLAQQTSARADTSPTPDQAIPCRSDPVIVVNGAIIDVVSSLAADPGAVREVDYQVTIPSGSLLGKTTLTVGLGILENVTYVFSPSQPWGSVQVAESVVPQDGVAPFPVSVKVSSLLAGSDQTSGTSGTTMTVGLDHLLML